MYTYIQCFIHDFGFRVGGGGGGSRRRVHFLSSQCFKDGIEGAVWRSSSRIFFVLYVLLICIINFSFL